MGNKEHYYPFIEQVFIDPIRSVLIIDDDYPTLDEVLMGETGGSGGEKDWHQNPERIYDMIKKFRTRTHPLLVDVNNGTDKEVGHLHQSDLLVLDYQLDKTFSEDGTRAIGILRTLMSNKHFNLVVVCTQIDIDKVFNEIRWGLVDVSSDIISPEEVEEAEKLIEQGEDQIDGLEEKLRGGLTSEGYFHFRLNPEKYLRDMTKGEQPYSVFCDWSKKTNWRSDQKELILRHLLKKIERENRSRNGGSFNLTWSTKSQVRWIRSDSAFIAFSKKSHDNDLMGELQSALNDWCPKPSRLFLAKIQSEMDESGFAAQEQALCNDHAAAYWYKRLLNAGGVAERRWLVAESVSRHSDQLMDIVLSGVEDFAMSLAEAEVSGQENASNRICKDRFNIDLEVDETAIQAALEHNEFVCSKKPEGWHLTTGHVFSMCDGEHWVCLSPACDMVPSQISEWNRATSDNKLPFIAVKLQDVSKNKTILKHVLSNRIVVFKIEGEIKGFCFNDLSREGSSPHWNLLYAENQGEFQGEFLFSVLRTREDCGELIFESQEARVIAQLRYEYALNLVQRLGISLTRIGLDFSKGQ